MITIVVADDHHVVRRALRVLLETETDLQVTGEASDGLETIEMVEHLKPDVVVLDLMMPTLNGLEVIRQVSQRSPGSRLVVLSVHSNEVYVLDALHAGAKAYVLKASTWDELLLAIREVAAGRRYLSPPLSESAIDAYMQKSRASSLDPYQTLTRREREVLHLVGQGFTNADIAAQLFISRRTAETHRANLMNKLGLRTQADLIRYAISRGISPPET